MSKTRSITGLTRCACTCQHRRKTVLECLVAEWRRLNYRVLLKQIRLPCRAFVV